VGCDQYILPSTKQGMTIYVRDQITRWADQVAKGKITEEEFGERGTPLLVLCKSRLKRRFYSIRLILREFYGIIPLQISLASL
jgi:hypothetical protein